jgi:anion-transporting  ArsA/GET3 family ATPase
MADDALLNKRLIFFTGKGGVGKSALSAALGLTLARRGHRVLLVEMNAQSRMAPLFGVKHVGYDPVALDRNLYALNVTPREALEEYMKIIFKFKIIYDRVINNNFFKVFTKALPGMDDLVTVGKIWYLEQDKDRSGRPIWDRIIVDAPATGHGVNFLRFPQVAIDTVRVGPIAKSAEQMRDLFLDERLTSVNLVTLAEELPVNETIELYQSLQDMVGVPFGRVFVNAVYPHMFAGETAEFVRSGDPQVLAPAAGEFSGGLLDAAKTELSREELNRHHIKRLEAAVKLPRTELPFVFRPSFDRQSIDVLSRSLEEQLVRA